MEGSARVSEDDRERLVGFLEALHDLLRRFVERQPPLISAEVLELIEKAWRELEHEGRFKEVERLLLSRNYDQQLVAHGLYGAQLDFKRAVFERADKAVHQDEGKLVRSYKRRKGLLAWALKAGNVILASLADAVPGGAAIREFKDATEAALDERVPLRQRIRASFGRWRRREVEVEKFDEPEAPLEA